MADPFEYDVFLSFSSADEEITKPIWQELCSNGLRVFWSDSTLKKEAGNSWFEVIEKSLERSKHMLLVCSENSMNSRWVQREYRAFFDYCYSPKSRRLVPLLTRGFKPSNLPLFLRELQVGKIDDPNFLHEIIPILGGINIEQLRSENQLLREQVTSLSEENKLLKEKGANIEQLRKESNWYRVAAEARLHENEKLKAATVSKQDFDLLSQNYTSVQEQIHKLSDENVMLKRKVEDLTRRMKDRRGVFSSETTLYVENLSDSTTDQELFSMFSKGGKVVHAWIITDPQSGRSQGSGFVEMKSVDDAKHALRLLDGMYLHNRRLVVKFSQTAFPNG